MLFYLCFQKLFPIFAENAVYETTIQMTTISLSYNEKNTVAKKAVEFILSLGVFKVQEQSSPARRKTLKAIESARKGKDVEIKAKTLVIDEIEVVECGLPAEPTLVLRVVCSKGTYIRALARDIGTALGSGAHLYGLRRTQVGDVRVEQCETLDGILSRLETEEMVSAEQAEQELLERERIANRKRAAILNAARKKRQEKKEQNKNNTDL